MFASSAPASSGSSSRAISGVPEPLLERRRVPPSPTSSAKRPLFFGSMGLGSNFRVAVCWNRDSRHAGESLALRAAASSLVDEFDLDSGYAATCLPGADTQVQLHSHRVGVVGANQGYLDFVVADLFGDRIQARAKELDEVREKRRVADAWPHEPQ
jgi:hypothetical protein